jgi:hypothetical protein
MYKLTAEQQKFYDKIEKLLPEGACLYFVEDEGGMVHLCISDKSLDEDGLFPMTEVEYNEEEE